jgi:hypothetical protein
MRRKKPELPPTEGRDEPFGPPPEEYTLNGHRFHFQTRPYAAKILVTSGVHSAV